MNINPKSRAREVEYRNGHVVKVKGISRTWEFFASDAQSIKLVKKLSNGQEVYKMDGHYYVSVFPIRGKQ